MRKYQLFLCLIGMTASLYLSFTVYSCAGTSCSAIHLSPYARVAGVPIAWIGVIGYSLLLIAYWTRSPLIKLLVMAGVLVEGFLVTAQVAIIHEFCPWCMLSAVVMFALFLLEFKWQAAVITGIFVLAVGTYGFSEPPEPPGIVLYDRGGNSITVAKDKPLLIFHPACSHCEEPIRKAATLTPEKRPILVLAAVWDESTWDESEEEARKCGFPDPIYTGAKLPEDQSLPMLIIGDQIITGNKKTTNALKNL
jgi:uncharacterized membrane protein